MNGEKYLGAEAGVQAGIDGFPDRLSKLIGSLNISQNEFARQLGASNAFVSDMVRGKKKPGLDFLGRLIDRFNVSLDWLICGKGTAYGEPFVDPDLLNTTLLRVALAELAGSGSSEARKLADELLGVAAIGEPITPARKELLNDLAAKTRHGPLLAVLYNRYLPVADANERSKDILRAALLQLQPSSSDPLAALLSQSGAQQQG